MVSNSIVSFDTADNMYKSTVDQIGTVLKKMVDIAYKQAAVCMLNDILQLSEVSCVISCYLAEYCIAYCIF